MVTGVTRLGPRKIVIHRPPLSVRNAAPGRRRTASPAPRQTRGRWVGWGFVGGAIALVPWMWVLATTMPSTTVVSNWSAAWVGLDAMEAVALLGTGVLLLRRDPRYGLGAAVAGTLLAVDAWFDVTTATPGPERTMAIALAAGLELPLAVLCAALAARALPRPRTHDRPRDEGRMAKP
ncbi:hypothetical protein ACQPZP_31655 [Spirillospora sp. CA-142024]|uniref:hypothetical protein n=1 Tax=Spirillospora sp. CA-142024 TaxID=3240036 RepID=UPI003D8A6C45